MVKSCENGDHKSGVNNEDALLEQSFTQLKLLAPSGTENKLEVVNIFIVHFYPKKHFSFNFYLYFCVCVRMRERKKCVYVRERVKKVCVSEREREKCVCEREKNATRYL